MLRAVAILALVVATTSQPPPVVQPPETPPKQEQPRDKHSDAGVTPASAIQLATNVGGGEKQQLDKKGHIKPPPVQQSKTSVDLITAFTGVLAIVAILQFLAMVAQAKYMREGLTDTKIAATAATSAAATSRSALELSERADVQIEAIDLVDPGYDRQRHSSLNSSSIVRVTVRNYGRTRAENLTVECFLVGEVIQPRPTIVTSDMPMVLGAGKPFELQFLTFSTYVASQVALKEITSGKSRLHIDAKIEYDDVFGYHHPVTCVGLYDWTSGVFRLTQYETDDKREG
ncbi:MAG TPA: hypothetical protein VLC46_04825 [Thermoanaerobaculia bacterium]|jgi:hypothetical protein|nr:hypothetical protein [Thermoanaerobaculia bacterium]